MYGNLIPIFNVSFSRKTQFIKMSELSIKIILGYSREEAWSDGSNNYLSNNRI